MKSISTDSKQVFAHPLLDRLSRCHPILPAILWVPVAVLLFVMGVRYSISIVMLGGLFASGLFLWTLAEYILHRWIFHFEFKNPTIQKLWYPVHMLHHDIVERDRLVAPPLMSVPLFFVFLGLFYVWPGIPYMLPLFSGFIVGYLAYDYVHYYTHFVRATSSVGKGLRKRHMQHHYGFPDKWYGISSPFWDYVFRTSVRDGERGRQRADEESATT